MHKTYLFRLGVINFTLFFYFPCRVNKSSLYLQGNQLKQTKMKTVFHAKFGKGELLSEDNTNIVIDFEKVGKKKILKKFAKLITEDEYNKIQSTPKSNFEVKQPVRGAMRLVSSSNLIAVLQREEDSMSKNYYFNLSDVVNSSIYSDGVDYYSDNKELIGDSWRLAMNFAKTR